MNVPIRVDYGVRALVDIALHSGGIDAVRSIDTSRRAVVPHAYLAQVLHSLSKAGLVKSVRGPKGGHMLAKNPYDIRLSAVMKSLDGSEMMVGCLGNVDFCVHVPDCSQRDVWKTVEEAVFNILDSVSIGDLAEKTKVTTVIG
jgi:Rrf2 family protein